MDTMSHRNRPQPPRPTESTRRIEAGPWLIELLPGSAYAARYVATQAAIGFAFDSQRGQHAIGSDRVLPFNAMPNGLAFVPAQCDVYSESPHGGEYLRVMRTDGVVLAGDRAFNNRIDPRAIALAQRMRRALLLGSFDDDWEAWAHALAERAASEKPRRHGPKALSPTAACVCWMSSSMPASTNRWACEPWRNCWDYPRGISCGPSRSRPVKAPTAT